MLTLTRKTVAIYVDRSTQQWIVRDPEGHFWVLPVTDHPWDERQPFEFTAESKLEPVPGHYKTMFSLPFT